MSVKEVIEAKLETAFAPRFLEVINESFRHSVPPGSETHFKVTMVADCFAGASMVKRHQSVYQQLADELKSGVHALALHLYIQEEWAALGESSPESPDCQGGSKQRS